MADLASLRHKYDPVVKLLHARGAQVRTIEMQGAKLLIKAEAPSADVKNAATSSDSGGGTTPAVMSEWRGELAGRASKGTSPANTCVTAGTAHRQLLANSQVSRA